jgi:hypothetical protein
MVASALISLLHREGVEAAAELKTGKKTDGFEVNVAERTVGESATVRTKDSAVDLVVSECGCIEYDR